jgi:hypothetical protein
MSHAALPSPSPAAATILDRNPTAGLAPTRRGHACPPDDARMNRGPVHQRRDGETGWHRKTRADQRRPATLPSTTSPSGSWSGSVGWTPLFPRAAAVITDIGAPLSHAAIVARELGIPAVVGTGNATTRLHTGDRVRVDGEQGTVEVLRPSG